MSDLENETAYLASLNDRELKAYHIAKDHLGMSFNMQLSNGYRDFMKEQASKKTEDDSSSPQK
jgi:hypothetical protein